jgi:dTDP-4-dehydrorhamnose 3,5-epimerase-like enzyme
MATVINLSTITDARGSLSVMEKVLPFEIKRVYYMYNVASERGGHRHKKSVQALICLGGSCEIYVNNGESEETILLDKPNKCLLLETRDWHTMSNFSPNATLLVFASDYYDRNDYIDERY